ncbi:hypothetical protein GCM10027610_119930 [Dactylosporangium cerinum]
MLPLPWQRPQIVGGTSSVALSPDSSQARSPAMPLAARCADESGASAMTWSVVQTVVSVEVSAMLRSVVRGYDIPWLGMNPA